MDTQRRSAVDPDAAARIEEVATGGSAAGSARPRTAPGGGGAGRTGSGRAGIGRWLPVVVVAGLAVAIVGAGLLGPKVPASEDPIPAGPTPAPLLSPGPAGTPAVAASPSADASPVPRLRLGGPLPADPFALLGGRWINIANGTVGRVTGCELERPLVLAGGRIVCVARPKGRPPGSTWATYALSVVTLGSSRPAPAEPWPSPPPRAGEGVRPPVPLTSLVGRRDLAFGDPVAVAVTAGAEPDSLLLVWAVLGEGGYRVGLDRYLVGDTGAVAAGSREILALPLESQAGPASLADLAVSVAPDGSAALVGVTITRNAPAPAERRLALLDLDAGAAAGDAVGEPRALPPESAWLGSASAAVARDGGVACGGALGEGWASEDTLFVVCPGGSAGELRLLAAGTASTAGAPARGPGTVVGTELLEPGSTQIGTAWLDGNGVAVDRARAVTYRWSPAAGTFWRIAVDPGGRASVTSLAVDPRRGYLDVVPAEQPPTAAGALPVLALDAGRGRLFALDAPVPGTAGRAVVHVVDIERWSHVGSFPLADGSTRAISLSPDGRLLYASTAPRPAGGAPLAVGLEVLDATTGVELAYAGRLRVGAGAPAQAVVVR
jgi:hypothetical protein